MKNSVNVRRLLQSFRKLPAWGTTDFSAAGWRQYEQAAAEIQKASPIDVEHALLQFLDETKDFAGVENETRLFLLMRLIFDLPNEVSADQRRVFKGWINWPEPTGGKLSLSWPVGFQRGQPVLLAPFEGSMGPRYGAIEEYRYLLDRFPFRKIGKD